MTQTAADRHYSDYRIFFAGPIRWVGPTDPIRWVGPTEGDGMIAVAQVTLFRLSVVRQRFGDLSPRQETEVGSRDGWMVCVLNRDSGQGHPHALGMSLSPAHPGDPESCLYPTVEEALSDPRC